MKENKCWKILCSSPLFRSASALHLSSFQPFSFFLLQYRTSLPFSVLFQRHLFCFFSAPFFSFQFTCAIFFSPKTLFFSPKRFCFNPRYFFSSAQKSLPVCGSVPPFFFLFFLPFFSAFSHYVLPFFSPSVQLKTFFNCFMSLYLSKSSFSSNLK